MNLVILHLTMTQSPIFSLSLFRVTWESRTHFRLRLSWTMHSTLSHLQLLHGTPSTTSQRTLRARHEAQALAARRFVTLPSDVVDEAVCVRFFGDDVGSGTAGAGAGDMEPVAPVDDRGDGVSPLSDIVKLEQGLFRASSGSFQVGD